MPKAAPDRPHSASPPGEYVIVASEYNREYVDGLLAHFETELRSISPGSEVAVHRVPGAFEIPLMVQEAASILEPDAIVAFGVIIEGSTAHAGLIAGEITRALMELGLEWETPVIHEVLLVRDEAQARARCLGDEINRGAEAARAAVRMVDALRVIRD